MNSKEIETIRNLIKRLQKPNLGCSNNLSTVSIVDSANSAGIECASRVYMDTWIIGALECLLPENLDVDTAISLSR